MQNPQIQSLISGGRSQCKKTTDMKKYYQLEFTLDPKIRGRYEMPHTVEITSKEFRAYKISHAMNMRMFLENEATFYKDMPKDLTGKLLKRKSCIDFMTNSPFCLTLIAVVSEKVKRIFDNLGVSEAECIFKKITIKKEEGNYYLMFVPFIHGTEFIYSETEFIPIFGETEVKHFKDYEEYFNTPGYYTVKKVTLPEKYASYKILHPQAADVFYSEDIIKAFEEEKVEGYDIKTGGKYLLELCCDNE